MIMRHGARNPTASALQRILKSLAKVEGRFSSDPALAFVEKFNYNTTQADQLTDFGRREMWTAGKRYAEEYKDLAGSAFSRADADDRVVESGGFFLQGFTGNDFDLDAKLEDVDVVSTIWREVPSVLTPLGDRRGQQHPIPKGLQGV